MTRFPMSALDRTNLMFGIKWKQVLIENNGKKIKWKISIEKNVFKQDDEENAWIRSIKYNLIYNKTQKYTKKD